MTEARSAPTVLDSVEAAVDALIAQLGKDLRIGLPLGLGKPIELINALYARAKADPDLSLTILTALSLEKPAPGSELERRFLQPFVDRVYGDCPDLDYMLDLRAQRLPGNVQVKEFFFKPGSNLDNAHAQRNYISTNYSFAARDVFAQGCNIAAQIVCKRETAQGTRYSLSCNPDTAPELIALARASGRPFAVVGLVNQQLPFMAHDAELGPEQFDYLVDHPRYSTTLFSTPKLAVTTPDYAIGLYASALVKDGGTLQIGIGALGDAIVHALQARQARNQLYGQSLQALGALDEYGDLIRRDGGVAPFDRGLYGASEMFVDGFWHLLKAGILKRKVYDFWALQQLINEGRCDPENLKPEVLDRLEALGVRVIRTSDFEVLQRHGFFNDGTRYEQGYLVAPDGERIIANVADPHSRKVMGERCLGRRLRDGIVLHGAFFLGPRDFYQGLRDMTEAQRREISMTGVNKVNQLDLNPRLYKEQRQHARFINTGIMATLSGAVMSDGLADGRVVSGVGGQYNFVAMAHQLNSPTTGGRSILLIRAVRDKEGKTTEPSSNIVFNYGHITIPRHLRDIVITEYGIADLRSRADSEVAKALINIADSRFQPALLDQAKRSGKIEPGYQIPSQFQHNTPAALEQKLGRFRKQGLFPAFPFGTDLTAEEIRLGKALRAVKKAAAEGPKWLLVLQALRFRDIPASAQPYLERMQLVAPRSLQDKVVRMLLVRALGQG
ncbi:MAG: acetyl-CoA hydrolase/transferase C-terminal domain-containing protein [Stagnimonas sp.]|nr:acetyl-CoA hydrolase/transferase C-terminal domain-containing protein [Stagnimonas sp.]